MSLDQSQAGPASGPTSETDAAAEELRKADIGKLMRKSEAILKGTAAGMATARERVSRDSELPAVAGGWGYL